MIGMFTARCSIFAHKIEGTHVDSGSLTVRTLHHDADNPTVSETEDVHERSPSAVIAL